MFFLCKTVPQTERKSFFKCWKCKVKLLPTQLIAMVLPYQRTSWIKKDEICHHQYDKMTQLLLLLSFIFGFYTIKHCIQLHTIKMWNACDTNYLTHLNTAKILSWHWRSWHHLWLILQIMYDDQVKINSKTIYSKQNRMVFDPIFRGWWKSCNDLNVVGTEASLICLPADAFVRQCVVWISW